MERAELLEIIEFEAKMGYGSLTSRRHALDSKSSLGGCQGPP